MCVYIRESIALHRANRQDTIEQDRMFEHSTAALLLPVPLTLTPFFFFLAQEMRTQALVNDCIAFLSSLCVLIFYSANKLLVPLISAS